MQIASEYRTRRILDEVGRGSNLDSALGLIADAVIAESGVPVCKIWVVKRGDICERCPLAESCTNHQMCMHLAAASGADLAKEFPRIPLAVFNATMIARGGVSDFSDPRGAGDKLFGLQRSHRKDALDTYALYPLRGLNGTVGLIGLFHHRPFHQDELRALEELAPAAVAAIRVAELQSRCDSLRARLDRETTNISTFQEAAEKRAGELEEAVAQLTHLVAQLQVERETLARDADEATHRVTELEDQNHQLRAHATVLEESHQRHTDAAAELTAQGEVERQALEAENAELKEKTIELAATVAEFDELRTSFDQQIAGRRSLEDENAALKRQVDSLNQQLTDRGAELEQLRGSAALFAQFDAEHSQLLSQHATLEDRYARLRDEHEGTVDTILELERSLLIAEDARTRHEQHRAKFESRIAEAEAELEAMRVEQHRSAGESRQLQSQLDEARSEREKLAAELDRLRMDGTQAEEELRHENTRLTLLVDELTGKHAQAEARAGALQSRFEALEEQLGTERAALEARAAELESSNARLNSTLSERLKEAVADATALAALRDQHTALAEDYQRLEARAADFESEAADLRPRTAELQVQTERLRNRTSELETEVARLDTRALDLEQENAALAETNQELQTAVERFESLTTRLEDSAIKLRTRAEASERARAELEQRSRVLAEQNRRLHSETHTRARILANMSHELRTPMNAIIGFTSLLLDDRSVQLQDRHRSNLERVARNARNLLELINNVLDLSKLEAGRMEATAEPAEARDIIERAVALVEPLKENRPIHLDIEIEDNLPTLRTDSLKLQQVLINLLSNAVKFTASGEVKVRAERATPDRVRISVSDTGRGIDEADLPRIFEEFRQVGTTPQSARTGTGLGLAIARRLVELLGGEIRVTSCVGVGSVFSVTLPLELETHPASITESEPALTDPERTALVIDSDPASLYLMKKYLVEAGYSVAATDDSGRGVEIARLARPGIVTVDLDQLESGISVIETIARLTSDGLQKSRAIIALASDADFEAAARGAGATVFARKPLERERLISLIERAGMPKAGRVLVADDDEDALALVLAILDERGYEIETARNGREVLEVVSQRSPDAIILDLMLPEMDGFEVMHRLNLDPAWRDIPVILLTARDLSHEERRALGLGANRIMQKAGFTRDELLAELVLAIGSRSEGAAS